MVLGGVYYFTSDRMVGHESRDKYHIYLGEIDHWLADDDQAFMAINKADNGGCCPIATADCPSLQYDSFVGCNGLVFYPTAYLSGIEGTYLMTLDTEFLKVVRRYVADSEAMETWQINFVCRQLDNHTS